MNQRFYLQAADGQWATYDMRSGPYLTKSEGLRYCWGTPGTVKAVKLDPEKIPGQIGDATSGWIFEASQAVMAGARIFCADEPYSIDNESGDKSAVAIEPCGYGLARVYVTLSPKEVKP